MKLAKALLVRPRVLLLSELFDLVPTDRLANVLRQLKAAQTTTLLCTGRPEDISLDGWFQLEPRRQRRFDTREALIAATRKEATDAVQA